MTDAERKEYRFLENVAAISADVNADARMPEYFGRTEQSFAERLGWCVDAARALASREPADYESADLDWMVVIGLIADGFFADDSPVDAVESALKPEPPTLLQAAEAVIAYAGYGGRPRTTIPEWDALIAAVAEARRERANAPASR